jgi:type I restriction enzyme S subunit
VNFSLPTLPTTWSWTRLDRAASVSARIGWKALTASEYVSDGYAFLSTPNIKSTAIDFENVNFISEFRYRESPELVLEVGDVLLVKDGNTLGITNIIRSLPRPATVNGSIAILRSKVMEARFLRYVLASDPMQQMIAAFRSGMGVPHLFQADIKKFPLPLPPRSDQMLIADYLDQETARIDALITGKQRMLSLVAQLQPAEFRRHLEVPSGTHVPWLGVIPSDWPLVQLRRVARLYMGTSFPHSFQGASSGDLPFIKVADFSTCDDHRRLVGANNWIDLSVAAELGAHIVPSGSVVFARVGAALLLNQRRLTTENCVVDDNVRGLKFRVGDCRFWLRLLETLDLGQLANPGPVPSVSEEQVMSIYVPLPPAADQRRIADSMETWERSAAHLQNRLKEDLDLLTERRQAVITAAVMGAMSICGIVA